MLENLKPKANEMILNPSFKKKALFVPQFVVEAIGWTGAALIIVAYGLLATGQFEKPSLLYHGMNFIGALGIIVNATFHKSWPPVVVNVFWACIAFAAIIWSSVGG